MPRKSRIDKPGYFYHIYCRGQRKDNLFLDEQDFNTFLKYLKMYLEKYDVILVAYCLMPNHVHLLVYRNEDSISDFMHDLESKYADYFNRKYNKSGYVFQGRFKSKIVLNEKYLKNLIPYIHQNPIRAKLLEKEEDYPFSSAKFYHTGKSKIKIKKIKFFQGKNGIKRYKRKLKTNITIPTYKDSFGLKEEYLKLEKRNSKSENYIKEKRCKKIKKNEICSILSIIIKKYGYSKKSILSKKNRTVLKIIRNQVILDLYNYGFKQTEIAKLFKLNKSTIFHILNITKKIK